MTLGADPSPDANPASGPYERLGISPDAGFDAVQQAKQQRLNEVGDCLLYTSPSPRDRG